MTIQPIKLAGDPALHHPAEEVKNATAPEVKKIIKDLIDTLHNEGGVGIAATQIGVPLQIMVIRISEERARQEKCDPRFFTVFINPKMEILTDQGMSTGPEGCFSLPGLVGKVPRYNKIKYTALNESGKIISGSMNDFAARVFQHEFDHLKGMLYWTHIRNCADFGFRGHLP